MKIIVEKNRKIKRKEETGCLFVLKTRVGSAAVGGGPHNNKKRTKLQSKIRKFKPFQGPPLMKLKKKVGNEFSLLV